VKISVKKRKKFGKRVLFWFIFAVIYINIGHTVSYLVDRAVWDHTRDGQFTIAAKILLPSPTTLKIYHPYIASHLFNDQQAKKSADFQTYRLNAGPAIGRIAALIWPLVVIFCWGVALLEWIIFIVHMVLWQWFIVGFLWDIVIKFLFSGSWTQWL